MSERIRYGAEHLMLMNLVRSISHVVPKDIVQGEPIIIIVPPHTAGKVIGKKAENLRKIEKSTGKRVKIMEYSADPAQFVRNIVYPARPSNVVYEDAVITITGGDANTRGTIIGRERSNLKLIKELTGRYFDISEILVD